MAGWKGEEVQRSKGARWVEVVRGAVVEFWTLLPQFIGGVMGLWLLYVLAMWITRLIGGG